MSWGYGIEVGKGKGRGIGLYDIVKRGGEFVCRAVVYDGGGGDE